MSGAKRPSSSLRSTYSMPQTNNISTLPNLDASTMFPSSVDPSMKTQAQIHAEMTSTLNMEQSNGSLTNINKQQGQSLNYCQ